MIKAKYTNVHREETVNSNTCGRIFCFTSFGESHGPAVGCVVDGCPAGVPLAENDIQPFLDRRRPGRNEFVSPRKEADEVRILSGVYDGVATGHPIMLLVENRNQRPGDYDHLRGVCRPGHADIAYAMKYGVRDPRGGGRSSARETIARVAAGAVAKKLLHAVEESAGVRVAAGLISLGPVRADSAAWDDDAIDANPFFCPAPSAVDAMAAAVDDARAKKNSLGGIVEIRAAGVPPGLGEPVYDRLDGRIGQMCLGLNAVKGVEIGAGFAAASMDGLTNNDAMRSNGSGNAAGVFQSNHAGGILGGVSTGQDIVVRCAVKPTPTIGLPQETVDSHFQNTELAASGRHDPAVCIRAVPVLEATMWLILADFLLLKRAGNICR